MEWFSYAVAVILFISSLVSPWFVNKENNKHQLNLKKIDLRNENYEDFFNVLNNYVQDLSQQIIKV